MQFLLPVGQVLHLDKVAVGYRVRVVKDLVLLEVHLERGLIREIIQSLFEFNEVLHTGQVLLHSVKGLVDRLLNRE